MNIVRATKKTLPASVSSHGKALGYSITIDPRLVLRFSVIETPKKLPVRWGIPR